MKRSRKRLRPCRDYRLSTTRMAMGYKPVYELSSFEKRLKRFTRFWKRNKLPLSWNEVWARFKGWNGEHVITAVEYAKRRPLPPYILADQLVDPIHFEEGPIRTAMASRSALITSVNRECGMINIDGLWVIDPTVGPIRKR